MKQIVSFLAALMLLSAGLPAVAQSVGDVEQFNMPKKDGRQGDKTVNGQLMFYDMGGPTGSTATYYAGYTRFVPSDPSNQILISFSSLELTDAATLYIYDGDIDFSSYSAPVPEGYLAKLTGKETGDTYVSTSGSLSVLYHCKGAGGGAGWVASVEELSPKTQEWKGATVSQNGLRAFRGQKSVPVMCVNLLTDGGRDAMECSSLAFNLNGTSNLSDISNLRVIYSKGSGTPSGEQFGETVTSGSGVLSFQGNISLRSGNNYFWLVGDINPNPQEGNVIDGALTAATVNGIQRIENEISAEGNLPIENIALLNSEHLSYNVGTTPLTLFDDGGPEGNISEKFEGSATFRPVTPGNKIRVKFNTLDLFNTSSTGLNDVLNIYNGNTTDDSALLASVLKELITVSSTADDGSLTISLVSKTGIPKGGFSATVEEFKPQAMEIAGITASHPDTTPVCAGQEGAKMLLINVTTQHTEPALKLSAFNFSNSSTADVKNAQLYYLGSSSNGTPIPFGECSAPNATFSISSEQGAVLKERDNYFLLTIETGERAQNGQTLDFALTSIDSAYGNTTVDNGNPEGQREISNIYYSTTGNHSKTIFGEWKFRNTPSQYAYYGYDDTEGDQISTFIPSTQGKVMELDFSIFQITKNSYSPSPKFIVYDGTSTSAPILWEMDNNTVKTGPGRTLRATNPQGALTVLFNSNGTKGAQGCGFDADMCEYMSVDMCVQEAKASQQNNETIVKPAVKDLPILSFYVKTYGDKNPLPLNSITLDLKECGEAVSKVKLYTTGKSADFAATQLIAEAEAGKQSVTLVPAETFSMPEKETYFHIVYDMADSFESDLPVDAAISELKIGGSPVAVQDADPEGAAITKNMYFFQDGDNRVTVKGSLMFYDDGGPDDKYSTAAKGSVTFVPANEGEVIRMTVKSFWTNYQDHLYIYDGADIAENAKATADISGSKSESALPITIISKSEDGALTAAFAPTKNKINNGWEILVESFVPKQMEIESVEVTQVNDVKMLRGSSDNQMLKLAVNVSGEKGTVTVSKLDFSSLESDTEAINNAKVWYTADIDQFDNNTLYGEALEQTPFSFSGNVTYDTAGTYYYWLTYDIDPNAANDSKIQAQFTSLTAGDATVTPAEEKSVLTTVQDGMHGTFSIGTSGNQDFLTITDAINALTPGIDGPVVFEIEDGNYNELVTIPAVIGSSERNTITFRSKSGKRENVIISYNTYRDPGSSAYDKRYGVVTFDGVDYCTLENLTVTTTATNFPGLVFLRNKSEHDALRNCVVTTATSKDSAKGSYLVYMYAKNEANCNNNYLSVEDCLFEGGYIGVGLTGTSYVALPKQRGGVIKNCTFRNQGSKGIYINCEEDASILNNTILSGGDTTSSYNAMDISDAGGNLTVAGNVISLQSPTASTTAMYIRGYNIDKMEDGFRHIFNNEINIAGTTGATTGIRINNEIPNLEYQYNTLRITGSGSAYAMYLAAGIPNGCISNNIIQNETNGSVFHVQREAYLTDVTFSHNALFTAGQNFAYIGADKSYEEWEAASAQTDSFNERTEFLSDNVLEPSEAGHLVSGLPVSYITTDLYGALRSATTPTIGAYEYAESTVAPEACPGYPAISNITHDSALLSVASTLTGNIHYVVLNADDETPDADFIKNEDQSVELRKGVPAEIAIKGLTPKTSYKVYFTLTSLRGMESGVIASDVFSTSYEPTRIATFEEAVVTDAAIIDGTMSFTGFSIADITDGVAPTPNTKAAQMDDEYAVVMLTNANNLEIEGMFMRNSDQVTLTSKDASLRQVATKTIEASAAWSYVDMRQMGAFTYLELESEGDVMIDNFAALPLTLMVSIDFNSEAPVTSNQEISVPAVVDGGVAPYKYVWRNAMRQEVGSDKNLTFTPEVSGSYTVEVEDARGAKASANTKMRVLGQQHMATFDDLYLEPDSHWSGDTEDEDYMNGSFFSGSFEFNNLYMADWDSWAFFGYANHTATSFSSFATDQWNSSVGHGVDDSENYGILFVSPFMGKSVTTLTNTTDGESIPGMYITNSAWVVDAVVNGDGMEGKFEQGDLLTLKVTGLKADGTSSSLEIPLADFRDSDAKEHWYLDSWQWVDLSALGQVKSLEWDMTSTKQNAYGMTTPAYVCLDNIGAEKPVKDVDTVVLKVNEEEPEASFSLAPYFSFDDSESKVTYNIECQDSGATLSDDGNISVTAAPGSQLTIMAHASQRGKHEYVRIPVSIERKPLGIDNVEIEHVALYPNPADTYINVYAADCSYSVEIISMDGRSVLKSDNLEGKATIDVSALASGNYLVKFSARNGAAAVRKLIVK